ncbi:MAG: 6-chlorohydroxyquinol-1,2-dioxygenase, partial [Alphaproteobacteria bacterium]|nr:6-chlorohydroxyquinol-1,2-dioxygenase [Alphaproteobacteria bacterium]
MAVHHNKTEDDITAEVLERFSQTPDPRLRQIMLGLVK